MALTSHWRAELVATAIIDLYYHKHRGEVVEWSMDRKYTGSATAIRSYPKEPYRRTPQGLQPAKSVNIVLERGEAAKLASALSDAADRCPLQGDVSIALYLDRGMQVTVSYTKR